MSELFTSAEQMQNASNYNKWTFDQFKKYIKGNVLEVGCGVGSFTKLIADNNNCKSLYAVDISKTAIKYIKKQKYNNKVTAECIDLINVNGKFDFIVCMNVMEHIKNDIGFFNKLLDLLDKEAVLFLLVPAHQFLYSDFDKAAGHYRRYSKKTMNKFILPDNIKMIKQYYFNIIGAIGYYVVYKILKHKPTKNPKNKINFFDKIIVPLSKCFLPAKVPFGISIISIYKKTN